jgi:hypothetical protein
VSQHCLAASCGRLWHLVSAVCTSCTAHGRCDGDNGCPRLAHLDRGTSVSVRRYERDGPGELVCVDVKKLGNIPDAVASRITNLTGQNT